MLDVSSSLILKYLISECKDGTFKIIEKSDIISALPSKYTVSQQQLDKIIYKLEQQDYISLRYDDDKVFCVCTLIKANQIFENKKNEKTFNKISSLFYYFIIFFITFIASFLSSFIVSFF